MIARLLRWVVGTAALAGIVHIVVVLLVPQNAPHTAYAHAKARLSPGVLTQVAVGDGLIGDLDPAFVHAACLLPDGGAIELSGTLPATPWSVAVIDGDGRVPAALTAESAPTRALDIVAGPAVELDRVRADRAATGAAPAELYQPLDTGLLLVRAVVASPGERSGVEAALAGLSCRIAK